MLECLQPKQQLLCLAHLLVGMTLRSPRFLLPRTPHWAVDTFVKVDLTRHVRTLALVDVLA